MEILGTIAVCTIGVVGYFVMADALRDFSMFRYPRIIAALVAVIGCIGIQQSGVHLAPALLIPFAALLLACSAVWVISRWAGLSGKQKRALDVDRKERAPGGTEGDASHNPWRKTK